MCAGGSPAGRRMTPRRAAVPAGLAPLQPPPPLLLPLLLLLAAACSGTFLPRRLEFEAAFPEALAGRPAALDDSPLCEDVHPELRVPCRCSFIHSRRAGEEHVTVEVAMDCDRVVFPGELPPLPPRAPIVSFSQRWAGHQALPTAALTTAELPLRRLDLAGNSLRRLSDRQLAGHLADHLQELNLAENLLGDNLNPIFSASEFHSLRELRLLDLSGNQIKGLEEGILKGCDNLQELRLDRNSLLEVPAASLHGPRALRALSLAHNRISLIREGALEGLQQLQRLDLSFNTIGSLEGGALTGLAKLQDLSLCHNRITKLNSDVFEGAVSVEVLDLSQNFLREVPAVAFKELSKLRQLNMSANLIQRLDNEALRAQTQLESLDLSGNNIGNIAPGTFRGLRALRHLDLSVNALRTVEDDAFEGLDALETLRLRDNNILAVPASALGRLPRLRTLSLDYNRLAVVSADLLRAVSERASDLGLARNVIRELSPAAFRDFTRLRRLDLSANLLLALDASALVGLEDTLEELDLSANKISNVAGGPLALRKLRVLDLSDNQLQGLGRAPLAGLPALEVLDLSGNPLLVPSPTGGTGGILSGLARLRVLDMSRVGMRAISADLLHRAADLESVSLAGNALQELPEGAFANLVNLTSVDLSGNQLSNVRAGAFTGLPALRRLNLSRNKLQAFRGEVLEAPGEGGAGASALRELDLSQNQLGYLFPNSFRSHPRLRRLVLNQNKLTFFPGELLAGLRYLEEVNLSGNLLKAVDDMDFARLPRLRELDLTNNQLEALSETAFHNSTQLQMLWLAGNRLERLSERTFEGLCRIELLDLEGNLLAELPDALFERGRVHILDNINLARNLFEVAPLATLQRQYFFLSSVDLSSNKLVDIPADDTIMVNIKRLDLSFNPLSQDAIAHVLSEPKTVRELNMAGTGIQSLTQLETPFLRSLNLSHNNITHFGKEVVARPTLMEMLDLSYNQLATFPRVGAQLRHLQALDVSNNPIPSIVQGDLEGLAGLRRLNIDSLPVLSRLERSALSGLSSLSSLHAAGYPRLGYLDAAGLLRSLPFLTTLRLELKDPTVGGDTLAPALQPRLQELGLHGPRVRSLSSSALAGLKAARVRLLLTDTSLAALPPALFFPLPRSCRLVVDVSRAKLPTLSPQLLAALDDRRGLYTLQGLATNPLHCDCAARALRRWLPASGMGDLRCHSPPSMADRLLVEVGDDDLTCDPHRAQQQATTSTTTAAPVPAPTTTSTPIITMLSKHHPTRHHARPGLGAGGHPTTEPDIIWSLPPTTPRPHHKAAGATMMSPRPAQGAAVVSNDDTLIIGIVGGVVAFIAILVIVICIVRLRLTSNQYRGGPMAAGPLGGPMAAAQHHARHQHQQAVMQGMQSGEYGPPPMYLSPYAAHGYAAATLPHGAGQHGPHSKMHTLPPMAPSLAPSLAPSHVSPRRTSYASLGRPAHTPTPCYPQQMQQQSPYYITFSGEEKEHR